MIVSARISKLLGILNARLRRLQADRQVDAPSSAAA
jgi:hypothetical protein